MKATLFYKLDDGTTCRWTTDLDRHDLVSLSLDKNDQASIFDYGLSKEEIPLVDDWLSPNRIGFVSFDFESLTFEELKIMSDSRDLFFLDTDIYTNNSVLFIPRGEAADMFQDDESAEQSVLCWISIALDPEANDVEQVVRPLSDLSVEIGREEAEAINPGLLRGVSGAEQGAYPEYRAVPLLVYVPMTEDEEEDLETVLDTVRSHPDLVVFLAEDFACGVDRETTTQTLSKRITTVCEQIN